MCQSFVSEEFCCPHNRYDSYINQVLIASMSHIMKWLLRGIGTVLKWLLKPIFKDFCLRSPLQFIWYLNTTFLKLLLKGLGQSWDTLAASRLKYIIVRHITSSVKRMYCQVLGFLWVSGLFFLQSQNLIHYKIHLCQKKSKITTIFKSAINKYYKILPFEL